MSHVSLAIYYSRERRSYLSARLRGECCYLQDIHASSGPSVITVHDHPFRLPLVSSVGMARHLNRLGWGDLTSQQTFSVWCQDKRTHDTGGNNPRSWLTEPESRRMEKQRGPPQGRLRFH